MKYPLNNFLFILIAIINVKNLSHIGSNSKLEIDYVDEEDDALFSYEEFHVEIQNRESASESSLANILDTLNLSLSRASEKVGLMAFGWLMNLITQVLSDYTNALIDDLHRPLTHEVELAYAILQTLYRSEHCSILGPCFFRILIAKGGLQAKSFAIAK
jgi:hypothetical protein